MRAYPIGSLHTVVATVAEYLETSPVLERVEVISHPCSVTVPVRLPCWLHKGSTPEHCLVLLWGTVRVL